MTIGNLEKQLEQERQTVFREKNIAFAQKISTGDLAANFGEAAEDPVGEALLYMRDNLQTAARREWKEKFITAGLAQMGNILRGGSDIRTLCGQIVPHLVKYLKANQGGLFILEDREADPHLELAACHAYERKKYLQMRIESGEGLAGQAWQEGETILLTDIPGDYIRIRSGLGDAAPRCLLIVPLMFNGQVEGVVELASFRVFEDFEIEFVERLAESMASAIAMARNTETTRRLLVASQNQTEELRSAEEELRQNMEEMQATQEHQRRLQEGLQDKLAELEEAKRHTEQARLNIT